MISGESEEGSDICGEELKTGRRNLNALTYVTVDQSSVYANASSACILPKKPFITITFSFSSDGTLDRLVSQGLIFARWPRFPAIRRMRFVSHVESDLCNRAVRNPVTSC